MGGGHAEHGEDSVTEEPVDATAVAGHQLHHRLQQRVDQISRRLGVQIAGAADRLTHVREDHGHKPLLAPQVRDHLVSGLTRDAVGAVETCSTLGTEPGVGRTGFSADRTGDHSPARLPGGLDAADRVVTGV
jgi:hypothetical protein